MKTIIQIYKEGKYFVAVDLSTNVVDQGLTEEEAIKIGKKDWKNIIRFLWS